MKTEKQVRWNEVTKTTTNIAPGTSVQVNYKKNKCIVKLQRIANGNTTVSHTTVDDVFVRNIHANNTATNQQKIQETTNDVISDNVEVDDRNSDNIENIDPNEITSETDQTFSKFDKVLNEVNQYF